MSKSVARPPLLLKKILVPTDFSPMSGKALEYAVALATQFDAEITLLHIAEVGSLGYEHGTDDFPRMEAELRIAAAKQIDDHGGEGAPINFEVGRGWPFGGKRPWHEIVEAARKSLTDLLIISTHGLTGLDHFFMGSTSERVVQHAPCPVLVVRTNEHDFVPKRPVESTKL